MLRAAYIWYLRINLNPFIAGTDFRNYDLKITLARETLHYIFVFVSIAK